MTEDPTTDRAADPMTMRGTVEYATRHETESPGAWTGELVRDAHGITIWGDDGDRYWMPYGSIAFVRLEQGNANAWAEAWKR